MFISVRNSNFYNYTRRKETDAAAILVTHLAQVVHTPDHVAKHLLLFRRKLRN